MRIRIASLIISLGVMPSLCWSLPIAGLVGATLVGCEQTQAPAGPVPDTVSPKDSPVAYTVLEDATANNQVQYHLLVADGTPHEAVEGLLRYLYRYLMQRREDEPAGLAAYVYTTEAAYHTPPRTPVAEVVKRPSDLGPTFTNRLPLSVRQELEQALYPRRAGENDEQFAKRRADEQKDKLRVAIESDEDHKTATVRVPFTESGKDEWAAALSFNQAMNRFTDTTIAAFDGAPDLAGLLFIGEWKGDEVVRIALSRADYTTLDLKALEDRIGQLHGRIFLELATERKSEAQATKENASRVAKEYRAMLAKLKGQAKVALGLK